ncbi:hypothetical protein [Desulfoferrobacter suflitae]|uniref:hypothetical protein n=1 Tax=Desulfoferrobacter suflitae TaxID=2865782 RepID=UPI0021641827|nr:hypothetical protein [Desulfoferrobacter suflitae]MCK8603386.1 hypothetical protein [Desulfoferrobacter suflitae]
MMFKTSPYIWAKDEEGRRYLCPFDELKDANFVSSMETNRCIHDDSELASRKFVPSNDPEGKLHFARSVSLN